MEIEDRLVNLEMKVAFQDDTIETFNQVIIRQQKHIDELEYQMGKLKARVIAMGQDDEFNESPEPPPPHY